MSDLFDDIPEPEQPSVFERFKDKLPGLGGDEDVGVVSEELFETVSDTDATLIDKIEGEVTGLGRLASKIPGIGGYMEKSRRRDADQILRKTIVDRLEASRLQLGEVHQELSRDIILAIDHAEPLGRVDTRLMGLIGKIDDAPTGYAGFFSAIKIKEEELERVYHFDAQMLDHADLIQANVDALGKAVRDNHDVAGAIRALDNSVKEANDAFGDRQEILSGYN